MKIYQLILILALSANVAFAQSQTVEKSFCEDPDFTEKVDSYLDYTIPVISVEALSQTYRKKLLLDARELEEYEVSHLPNALHIGYKSPNWEMLKSIPKDTQIVIYCSIGYRSEKLGTKLKDMGYLNITNLYGSIFEWANQDRPLVDKEGQKTNKVHGYNKKWSKWIKNPDIEVKR
ncbi:MAG: rhodanese-like domain-containing protein [Saprospiraceae bacterium]|nr:rhodanese-like domain-containing protein [Saprospiraceae bacterium]